MTTFRSLRWLAVALMVAGCASGNDAAPTMPDVRGFQLDVALKKIEAAGISDDVDVEGGGTFGIIDKSNWKVCAQSPAAGERASAAPKLEVARRCGDAPEAPEQPGEVDASTSTPQGSSPIAESPVTTAAGGPVLTADSSPDVRALLGGSDCSPAIGAFVEKYRGQTISFDGNIAALSRHADATTRFDILIAVGDVGNTSPTGPSFQFRDVGMLDLGLTGSNVPDSLTAGLNVRVVAKVREFVADQCLLLIDPVSTELR